MTVGRDIREKLSGAVEAFTQRNRPNATPHHEHVRRRTLDEVQYAQHNPTRYESNSRRAVISSSKPNYSGDHTGRMASNGGRPSAAHRGQPVYETRQPTFARNGSMRGNRDDPLRSFELLTIRR
jgi:hypothetical protein